MKQVTCSTRPLVLAGAAALLFFALTALPLASSAVASGDQDPPSAKTGNPASDPAKTPPEQTTANDEKTDTDATKEPETAGSEDAMEPDGPVAIVAAKPEANEAASALPAELADLLARAREEKHPLLPALEYAVDAVENIRRNVRDYTCLMVKRERINGKLSDYQYMNAKIRHEQRDGDKVTAPFSVYLKFLAPARYKEREVLYVDGKYNNDVVAKRGGRRNKNLTLRLDPTGPLAMDGNRYPIMEIGFYNLAHRLIEVMQEELAVDDAVVEVFDNAKLNGRVCKRFKVTHPEKRDGLRFHVAEVLVDKELNIPVYYAAYTWPSKPDGKPRLLEQYFYTSVKLNVGLTDKDFDIKNDEYGFRDIDTFSVSGENSESDEETGAGSVDDTEPKEDNQASSEEKDG